VASTVDARAAVAVVTPPPAVVDAAAAVVVASPPDAAPPVVVAAVPDAAVAAEREADRYATLLEEARGRPCPLALRIYESAIDLRPRGAEALVGLAGCLLALRDYDRAISNFRAALAVSPRNPEALFGAAEAYREKGRDAEAIEHYQRYLKIAPRGAGAAQARRNLELLRDGGQSSDESLFGTGSRRSK
jgi:tetratricopeptide (TPR) repeat protein